MRKPLLVVLALAGACSNAPAPSGTIATRDSAGIEIVEHPAGYEATLPVWTLSEPVLDLGGREAPGHDLHRVGGAARLGDGRLVVINRSSGDLRVFDSTGRHLATLGRRGEGPGEFSNFISSIQVLPGDTLLVFDSNHRRGTLFSPNGDLIRTISIGSHEEDRAVIGAALVGERLVARDQHFPEMRETDGPSRRDSVAIVFLQPNQTALDTLVVVPGEEVYPTIGREGGQAYPTIQGLGFGRTTTFTTGGNQILVGANEAGGVRVYDSEGRLVRLVRSATPPEPVSEQHRRRRIQEGLERVERMNASEQIKATWRQWEESRRFAEVFAYHERVMFGTDGSIWLERQRRYDDEGRRFVVHDSSGRAIATLRCPDRMRPFVVGPEIIGLLRDADDVEHVVVYRVLPSR